MITLRGHHLVCLHFFKGKGYSEEFAKTVDEITKRLKAGEVFKLVYGADDLCISCPHLKNERCSYSRGAENEVREMDRYAVNKLNVSPYNVLKWDKLKKRIKTITTQWKKRYCNECEWWKTCFP